MDKKQIYVTEEEEGVRLDLFAARNMEELTRSAARRLIDEGALTVNGSVRKASYEVQAEDLVEVLIPEPKVLSAAPMPLDLSIIYEDESLLVINKQRGLVVHPAAGHESDTLVNGLMYALKGRLSSIGGTLRPGIVHRIDKDTSGLLLVCKTDEAHTELSKLFARHELERTYVGVVCGRLRHEEGVVDAPIGRQKEDRKKMTVRADGREARTHYKVMEELGGYSLVSFRLETGRTHQIRVHMKHLGHPLLGDPLYGNEKFTGTHAKELSGLSIWPGQILHAKTLGFWHPQKKELLRFDSELPDYFQDVLRILRS